VRTMATMSFTGDHKIWNGESIVRLMAEVGRILESGELAAEVPTAAAEGAMETVAPAVTVQAAPASIPAPAR
jgi:hypothetical protein